MLHCMKTLRPLLIVSLLILLGTGCQEDDPIAPTMPVAPTATMAPTPTLSALETLPAGSYTLPVGLYDDIVADLADHLGASLDEVGVIRAEAAIWNNGALGCPTPGVEYSQAQVDGYWVILLVDDLEYDYRIGENESFFLCDRPFLPGGGNPSG